MSRKITVDGQRIKDAYDVRRGFRDTIGRAINTIVGDTNPTVKSRRDMTLSELQKEGKFKKILNGIIK